MNSRWQINRVGLIDFWYYDEQEFDFLDGRLLLRGANGSGKSVTMQSFIPLLLDGNMRPERLDPFGSRARKMENYLLEEGDEREERTGYLYMELKREASEDYLSLGMGIRARKNKKLESWYFCITDGRRIGRDIFLYKDMDNKITYSKTELKNRIGEGGRVIDTQGEYAQCVNRLLFGFETQEEYRELLELLIQLRTPKLSKDFKPSVINEILSSSLQTLSEDDLRPMSEAIENMDSLKTNLDTLNDGIRAARQIERVYDQYNQIVLYDKALLFVEAAKSYDKSVETGRKDETELEKASEKALLEVQRYEKLRQEEEILKGEKDSLDKSDAARLKEEELRLAAELEEKKKEQETKERQEQDKKEKQGEAIRRIQDGEEKNQTLWEKIEEDLEEMGEALGEIPFDEFEFLRKELCEEPDQSYAFSAHHQLLNDYTAKVRQGEEALGEEKNARERYDRSLSDLDQCRGERDQAEREVRQYEKLLQETKSELTEGLYLWEKQNQELHLSSQILQAMSRGVESYEMGMDYSEIRDLAKPALYEKERNFVRDHMEIEKDLKQCREELESSRAELEEWKNKKDPEPEQSERVRENRRLLKEKGIPYDPFYRTVDFVQGMDGKQADRLEEALLETGILDALIIPAEYREKVYALDQGVCDRYIFSDVSHVRQNLMQALDVDNEGNDILFYQSISNILSAVGFKGQEGEGSGQAEGTGSWIDQNGNYRMGILEGTISKDYKAHFIGVRARENYRKEKVSELTVLCEEKERIAADLEKRKRENESRMEKLQAEWEGFPDETDLKTAAKAFADHEYELDRIGRKLKEQQEITERDRQALEKVSLRAQELCRACYLPPRLDVFRQALTSLYTYRQRLSGLQASHAEYLNGLHYVEGQKSYREEIEQDLDDIRYDLGKIRMKAGELEGRLDSIRGQLQLTDYEQIRERLDYCIQRLNRLPKEREDCARRQEALEKEKEMLQEKILENHVRRQELLRKRNQYQTIFEKEYGLDYVERRFVVTDDMEDQAAKVCAMLSGTFGNKKQTDLFGSLQEVYHQNRGYLLDYQITLQTLFEELDQDRDFLEAGARRIDISGKYRGMPVKFKELIGKMTEDAQAISQLLSDRDRELFEDILANTISKKIRGRIQASRRWVDKMNALMESMQTSSGLKLSLRWKNRRAEAEEQLDTKALVELLQKDVEIMREEEVEALSRHFRSKIQEARKIAGDTGAVQSFHGVIREVLDYRKWFEFQLECQKTGEKKKELTDRVFFTFSGGEKAMAMYVPLFSAVVAKYAGARPDAPKLISLDEAFAGVDEMNIRDMFRLMVEFGFNFMINSQILWGDYDTVPALAIYQLIRPENARFVSVIRYIWNGKTKTVVMGGQ